MPEDPSIMNTHMKHHGEDLASIFKSDMVYLVLEYLPIQTIVNFNCVSRSVNRFLSTYHHHFIAKVIARRFFLYCPAKRPTRSTWLDVAKRLWKLRYLWTPHQCVLGESKEAVDENNAFNFDPLTGDPIPFTAALDSNSESVAAIRDEVKLEVHARFRPLSEEDHEFENDSSYTKASAAIPLHQRVKLMQSAYALRNGNEKGKELSSKDALKILREKGVLFHELWKEERLQNLKGSSAEGKFPEDNDQINMECGVQSIDSFRGSVHCIAPSVGLRQFIFNSCMNQYASQRSVYQEVAAPLVIEFLNGYNTALIAYGQTGSGKTYSMFGPNDWEEMMVADGETKSELSSNSSDSNSKSTVEEKGNEEKVEMNEKEKFPSTIESKLSATASSYGQQRSKENAQRRKRAHQQRGMISRVVEEVFQHLRRSNRNHGIKYGLCATYIEVFGGEVTDLLNGGERVGHSAVSAQKFVLEGHNDVPIESLDDLNWILAKGEKQKTKAATAMNKRSTRAHSLLILTLRGRHGNTKTDVKSQFFFADLGGSEQVKKSKVNAGEMSKHTGFQFGKEMRQAIYINYGLLALKKVMRALNKKDEWVPYTDSKLTMLLSPALGGDCKASVLVTASLAKRHIAETVQTLRFGEMCTSIDLKAKSQATQLTDILAQLDKRRLELEDAIRKKEKWVTVVEKRKDVNKEEGSLETAQEFEYVKTSKLVGAEVERKMLQELVKTRGQLTGNSFSDEYKEAGFGNTDYGVKASALAGNAESRFKDETESLKIKGKVQPKWEF